MKFTVRVFLGGKQIEAGRLGDIVINSPVVNRIVDAALERTYRSPEARDPEEGDTDGQEEKVCK